MKILAWVITVCLTSEDHTVMSGVPSLAVGYPSEEAAGKGAIVFEAPGDPEDIIWGTNSAISDGVTLEVKGAIPVTTELALSVLARHMGEFTHTFKGGE